MSDKVKKTNKVFPNWLLWISLVVLTVVEMIRLIGGMTQYNFPFNYIISLSFLFLLWQVPSKCIWHIIKNTKKEVKYPVWSLWIILVFFVYFKLDNLLAIYFRSPPEVIGLIGMVITIIMYLIFVFLSILIPSYCIWNIIQNKKVNENK